MNLIIGRTQERASKIRVRESVSSLSAICDALDAYLKFNREKVTDEYDKNLLFPLTLVQSAHALQKQPPSDFAPHCGHR